MPYVVAQPCVDVKDKACVDECPVDCIYEGSRSLYINPNECVDRIWTADSFSGPVRLRRFHAPKANRFFVWTDDHAVGPIAVCWSMV